MVLTSNRPGGVGQEDVWISTRARTSEPWGPPVNVTSVNTSAHETGAFITTDGLELYLASNRDGAYDLYIATRSARDQPFGPRVPVTELNSPTAADEDPWVSPDGRHVFYMRKNSGANSQLLHATR